MSLIPISWIFRHPDFGDMRWDPHKPGRGPAGYHWYNPNVTGKRDMYLDKNGKPCGRGSKGSHLGPSR